MTSEREDKLLLKQGQDAIKKKEKEKQTLLLG